MCYQQWTTSQTPSPWASTLSPEEEDMAIYFEVQPGVLGGISANAMDTDRYLGHSIRAVTE